MTAWKYGNSEEEGTQFRKPPLFLAKGAFREPRREVAAVFCLIYERSTHAIGARSDKKIPRAYLLKLQDGAVAVADIISPDPDLLGMMQQARLLTCFTPHTAVAFYWTNEFATAITCQRTPNLLRRLYAACATGANSV